MATSRFASLPYSEVNMDIIAVKPLPTFELDLSYADGSKRRFDMKPLLAIKPWNKIAALPIFMQVKAAYGTAVCQAKLTLRLKP